MTKTIGFAVIVIGAAWWALGAGAAEDAAGPATRPSAATGPSSQPAKELTLDLGNKVTMKLALIPSGKFMMGSPETEKGRDTDEAQHEVTISKAFYMGTTHVTVDQFAAFVKDSGYKTDAEKDGWSAGIEIEDGKIVVKKVDGASWRKPSFDQKGDHPVVQVSWNDAKAFCDWLSKKSGKKVALPTEARFEYACRGGAKTAYPWGDSPDDGKGWANCADQSLKKKLSNAPAVWTFFSWDDGFVFTSPVGSFKGNSFGLYDMIGNAFEWCSDWYDKDYYANCPKTDPQGPASGAYRVLRGGGWLNIPQLCRSALRPRLDPGYRYRSVGFRVVLDFE
jgi:formylglycine-generating enzyme required for sulfatase activity